MKKMMLDFLNSQNMQDDELKEEMQSILEDIEAIKVSEKQSEK